MAQDLMAYYGLRDWAFSFDKALRRYGCCFHRKKRISLSAVLTELGTEDTVLDTILHEVAHALTPYHGHNRVWRMKAAAVGCTPRACSSTKAIAPRKFQGTCPACGHTIQTFRRGRSACRLCCNAYNQGKFSAAYSFQWSRI